MTDDTIPRRNFLKGAGAASTAAAAALTGALAPQAEAQTAANASTLPPANEALLTLTADEAAFFSAAYDTLIPADKLSPSGTDCGLVLFIDRQLAGAWGNGRATLSQRPVLQGQRRRRAISFR